MPNNQKKITLNELSLADVFNTRLDQETWQTNDEKALRGRLITLFQQAISEVKSLDHKHTEEQVKPEVER
jgi:hypothetical protein